MSSFTPYSNDNFPTNLRKLPAAASVMALSSKEEFGLAIATWLRKNEWPQRITEDWCSIVGAPGPWSSQMSQCINNRFHPRPEFFVSLGQFNAAVGDKSELKVVRSNTVLHERMSFGAPFLMPSGEAATALDFFGMYTGLIKIPAEYREMGQGVTKELIAEIFADVDRAINLVAMETMQDRGAVLRQIDEGLFQPHYGEFRDDLKQQLLGIHTFPIKRFEQFVKANVAAGGCPITTYCLLLLEQASAPVDCQQQIKELHAGIGEKAMTCMT